MDAILVGAGTVLADDPMLNARPKSGKVLRQPLRVVADARLETPLTSALVQTAREFPVLLAVGSEVPEEKIQPFEAAGCEIFRFTRSERAAQMAELLDELGRRRLTNLLVEGGSSVLGALLDLQEIDEIQAFIAPKLCGGRDAVTPIGGHGIDRMEKAFQLETPQITQFGPDVLLTGRVVKQTFAERFGDLDSNRRLV